MNTVTRRGSSSGTKYIYNKSRTGPYPAKSSRQQRSLTFNETFRALFPAIFAVLISLMVLSAFNHFHGNKIIDWINDNAISIPGYKPSNSIMNIPTANQVKLFDNKPQPFDFDMYEKLGAKTSGSYWSNKGREMELKQHKDRDLRKFTDRKYQSFGPLGSSSFWERKGREMEMEEKKVSSQFN
ncbi:hypothetical protein DICPUDRAFT_44134 [Dictyostelium purpureum]|uniref:Transmembrane protein n=1 Tax=Dictyostelium purpureum TaxID=5786 RepID=F1A5J0_DICPU|nr:uncharacterized protein DICPUDRAFT_44134 [Dictyostelium purpureum]EGC28541.1 hypothetical protein DICPUDRAFT_44134 [Dictyostelium purpureum]|eukprot:XP_003294934.1 hypothetical protein DICPUDRAFT_44134 [Dictyostelium purpureum]